MLQLRAHLDVSHDCFPRKQCIFLKYDTQIAHWRPPSGKFYFTRRLFLQTSYDIQKHTLSALTGSKDNKKFVFINIKCNIS